MQVIIMAGGKGMRLRPITNDLIPKPLIPLNGKTLLDYLIGHIKQYGGNNIIICTGHLGHMIKKHVEKNEYGASVRILQESKPLGSAGALQGIKDVLEDEFFIVFSDVYTTINLQQMLQFHKKKQATATIALHRSDHPHDSTVVTVNDNNRILNFVEKPGNGWKKFGNLTATSLYIVNKSVLHFIPKDKETDFSKDVFPALFRKDKKIFGYITKEYAKDIGTPERYKSVLRFIKK